MHVCHLKTCRKRTLFYFWDFVGFFCCCCVVLFGGGGVFLVFVFSGWGLQVKFLGERLLVVWVIPPMRHPLQLWNKPCRCPGPRSTYFWTFIQFSLSSGITWGNCGKTHLALCCLAWLHFVANTKSPSSLYFALLRAREYELDQLCNLETEKCLASVQVSTCRFQSFESRRGQ